MPSSKQFCGYCDLPVMKHKESTGLINGVMYHKRRCYPKHLKEMRKRERNAKKESGVLHHVSPCVGTNGSDRGSQGQRDQDGSRV
jgi:endonuclease I